MLVIVMSLVVLAFLPILGILGTTLDSIADDSPVVTIPDGQIVGTENTTEGAGSTYYAFRGIPYAQPPLDSLRFASPVKNANWTGYWDATADATECIQGSGDNVTGSEDCLYINVYTPSLTATNLTVMVWIYGGGFNTGDSKYTSFAPDYFLDQEIVFVSFNYRGSIFGFLCTDDESSYGNWGIKDQVFALQWVKDNIQYFGGNPNNITIFGESAGAASVSYLLQVPQAQGLFNAAIMESGTSEMLWTLNTRARETAFLVGTGLGIISISSKGLVKGLRNADAYTLQKQAMIAYGVLVASNPFRGLPFAPVIEVNHTDAVLTKPSDDYLKSGKYPSKVPVLLGYNSNEAGAAKALTVVYSTYLLGAGLATDILPPFSLTSDSLERFLVANEIKVNYFGLNALGSLEDQLVKFINTDQFMRGARRFAENVARVISTYFYVFGYEGQVVGNNSYSGVGHGEDVLYLSKTTRTYSAKDFKMRSKLIRLWTNFAKTCNPTPIVDPLLDNVTWPTVGLNGSDFNFVWLNETISLDTNPDDEAYVFYNSLFEQFGDDSYTTY